MEYKEPRRVVMTMKVKPETKEKLDTLKRFNPDIPWDTILEPIIKPVRLPKAQCASVKPPPIYSLQVKYPDGSMKAPDELPDLSKIQDSRFNEKSLYFKETTRA